MLWPGLGWAGLGWSGGCSKLSADSGLRFLGLQLLCACNQAGMLVLSGTSSRCLGVERHSRFAPLLAMQDIQHESIVAVLTFYTAHVQQKQRIVELE